MANTTSTPYNALLLGDDALYDALIDYCRQAAADVSTAANGFSKVIPAAGSAMHMLSMAPMALGSKMITLNTQRYFDYLGPVACHERRATHLTVLTSNISAERRQKAYDTTEAFIRQQYPYKGDGSQKTFQYVLRTLGSTHSVESSWGSNGYRHEFFHYPQTGPAQLGKRLLSRLLAAEQIPAEHRAELDWFQGGCNEGSWVETVSKVNVNHCMGVRAFLTITLPRPQSTSTTTLKLQFDYDDTTKEISGCSWDNRGSDIAVFNGMECTLYGGGHANVDLRALRAVLSHYMGVAYPEISRKTLDLIVPGQSPYVAAEFKMPELWHHFLQEDGISRFPYKSSRFHHTHIRFTPKGEQPFVQIVESQVDDVRRIWLKIDNWMELQWTEPGKEDGTTTVAAMYFVSGQERTTPNENLPVYFGTEEGIEVVQQAITAALEIYVAALVEHRVAFEQLARLEELSSEELSELRDTLDSHEFPFAPLGNYGDITGWSLDRYRGY